MKTLILILALFIVKPVFAGNDSGGVGSVLLLEAMMYSGTYVPFKMGQTPLPSPDSPYQIIPVGNDSGGVGYWQPILFNSNDDSDTTPTLFDPALWRANSMDFIQNENKIKVRFIDYEDGWVKFQQKNNKTSGFQFEMPEATLMPKAAQAIEQSMNNQGNWISM